MLYNGHLNGNLIMAFKGISSVLKDILQRWNGVKEDEHLMTSLIQSKQTKSAIIYFQDLLESFYSISVLAFLDTLTMAFSDYKARLETLEYPLQVVFFLTATIAAFAIFSSYQKLMVMFNSLIFIVPFELVTQNKRNLAVVENIRRFGRLHN